MTSLISRLRITPLVRIRLLGSATDRNSECRGDPRGEDAVAIIGEPAALADRGAPRGAATSRYPAPVRSCVDMKIQTGNLPQLM